MKRLLKKDIEKLNNPSKELFEELIQSYHLNKTDFLISNSVKIPAYRLIEIVNSEEHSDNLEKILSNNFEQITHFDRNSYYLISPLLNILKRPMNIQKEATNLRKAVRLVTNRSFKVTPSNEQLQLFINEPNSENHENIFNKVLTQAEKLSVKSEIRFIWV